MNNVIDLDQCTEDNSNKIAKLIQRETKMNIKEDIRYELSTSLFKSQID